LAFGSLVLDGCYVRLSGQDSGRGTFSQRHLNLYDYENGERFCALSCLKDEGATGGFGVFNSTLSEAAVLGFEYGYSTVSQDSLVMWEAQFGDFVNGAQVIIDQFMAASEAKWNQRAGVMLLLPHGYEGQGPDHSSARLERFLQLCAEGNMVVCYPSTSSQYFHLLRRQGLLPIKRPVVIMTPKSMLRNTEVACHTEDLVSGQFETVLEDDFFGGSSGSKGPEHVVILSGKIFYELRKAIGEVESPSIKIIRLEQLYPFPQYEFKKIIKDLNPKTYTWVQEEPQNMGAWGYLEEYLRNKIGIDVQYVGRPASASTATGSGHRHAEEQQAIINQVLSIIGGYCGLDCGSGVCVPSKKVQP